MPPRDRPGFTLMEVTLTVGILAILLTITLSISQNAIARSGLRTAENIIIQTLRRAQVLSQNNVKNPDPSNSIGSEWGVYLDTGSVILFARDEYNPPDSVYDRVFEINPRISLTGSLIDKARMNEPAMRCDACLKGPGVVFSRFLGEPTTGPGNTAFSGVIIMRLDANSRQLIMNGKGVVERN